jgi:pimeloyl-ACP methyl ester carboxylesterase
MQPSLAAGQLAYISAGEGIPVVLLHGFCENKQIWQAFVDELSTSCRVIAVDLPGFGENEPISQPLTIADMAESLYHFLQNLGIDQCVLIGRSLGGYVSLAFGEKFQQRLLGLGLFNSTAYSDSLEKKQGRTKSIEFVEKYGVDEFTEEFLTPLFFEGRRKELQTEIRKVVEAGKKTPTNTVIEVIKAMRDRKDRTKVLEKSTYPILFISAKNDTAVNFTTSVNQFWLPADATIHILSNTGHMALLERPKETLNMVRQFVQTLAL